MMDPKLDCGFLPQSAKWSNQQCCDVQKQHTQWVCSLASNTVRRKLALCWARSNAAGRFLASHLNDRKKNMSSTSAVEVWPRVGEGAGTMM